MSASKDRDPVTEQEARGFALYVGISEAQAQQAGLSLAELVAALREHLDSLAPGSSRETYAAVALSPKGVGGRSLDITRLALKEPAAAKKTKSQDGTDDDFGIAIDTSRKRVNVDGNQAGLTCREFELLLTMVKNPGRAFSRDDLATAPSECREAVSNARTIDVHIRRLRGKIPGYEDIIRTVRGIGYRFDRHPDVKLVDEL